MHMNSLILSRPSRQRRAQWTEALPNASAQNNVSAASEYRDRLAFGERRVVSPWGDVKEMMVCSNIVSGEGLSLVSPRARR